MLKVTMIEGPLEQRLVLEGRLTECEISVLESAWEEARQSRGSRSCIVDLKNATFLDPSAERILLQMKQAGAQFLACGVATTHQLEQLGIRCKNGAPSCR